MPPIANEPVISFVRRTKTSPTAPIGNRPISEATNGAPAPDARRAVMKPGGRVADVAAIARQVYCTIPERQTIRRCPNRRR